VQTHQGRPNPKAAWELEALESTTRIVVHPLPKGGSTDVHDTSTDVYDTANTVSNDVDKHLHYSNATTTNGDMHVASGNSVPACYQFSALSTDEDYERVSQIQSMGAIHRSAMTV